VLRKSSRLGSVAGSVVEYVIESYLELIIFLDYKNLVNFTIIKTLN
jgi:hypothetical protein